MAETTMKVLKAQEEYWHAGHLAEQLIEAGHILRTILDNGLPGTEISAAAIRKCKFREAFNRLAKNFVREFKERRPALSGRDPVLAAVNKDFEALFAACVGRRLVYLYRRIEGTLLECAVALQNWIVTFNTQVEAVTKRSAFEWVELAATLTDIEIPIDGPDGRHARLRRIVGMLDSVVAMGDINRYESVDSRELDKMDPAQLAGVCVPVDRFTVLCEMVDPDESDTAGTPRDALNDTELAQTVPLTSVPGLEKPPVCELRIDPGSRAACWGNTQLTINSSADFELLRAVYNENGGLVRYATLLSAIKPNAVSPNAQLKTAPPEVREAVEHINKAFKGAGCGYCVKNARKLGYRLRSPDK